MWVAIVREFILSFLGSASSGILFRVPRRALVSCGLMGSVSWLGLKAFGSYGLSDASASFLAAFTMCLCAELLSRWMRLPVPCLTVPGMIPLVPGLTAYRAMFSFVTRQYPQGAESTIQTLLIAGAISAGLAMAHCAIQACRACHEARRPQVRRNAKKGR